MVNEIQDNQNRIMKKSLDDFLVVAKALSSDLRISIFKELLVGPKNIAEISAIFQIPPSTAALNIKKLEDSGLIRTELVPGTRGTQKLCSAVLGQILVDICGGEQEEGNFVLIEMPVGHFYDASITSTCGMISENAIIGEIDDPETFYEPERINAQLIWFRKGYLEYRFPKRNPHGSKITNLELSMEICSEAPLYNPNWPSDITLSINGKEIGTWTSPGDFGAERGLHTPSWWLTGNTQYGLLKTWRVNPQGSFIDGKQISNVPLGELCLDNFQYITVRIEVKEDALNDGGVNLFGKKFGNYASDMTMRLDFMR